MLKGFHNGKWLSLFSHNLLISISKSLHPEWVIHNTLGRGHTDHLWIEAPDFLPPTPKATAKSL
jgi:hypothetical protein